jgi:phage baseplate assembly protein W
MAGLAVRLPLVRDNRDGLTLITDYKDLVSQNLLMLVLTVPGEKMMDPEFGVGARRYLFENLDNSVLQSFQTDLMRQVQRYMPFLTIQRVQFVSAQTHADIVNENYLGIRIYYFNRAMKIANSLDVPVTN